nr:replication protein [uncultured Oscillibacter sp.]
MAKDERKRNWVFVVYPDSAPENWREILRGMLVPGFISPLHDKDVNADGEPKKPHWHVLLTFKGNKSYEQIKEITDGLNAPAPQVCKDIRAYARYLCHLDNPEKVQYEVQGVECLGGADYLDKVKSAADTDTALSEMMDWCIDQGCFSFFRLSNYARRYRTDWFRVISSSRTVFLTAWLKSMEWEVKNGTFNDAVGGSREQSADGAS